MTVTTTVKDTGAEELFRQVAALRGQNVKVGVQANAKAHKDSETGKTSKMVIIASTHEFGTKKAGRNKNITIPRRSFIRSTVDEKKKSWLDLTAKIINAIEAGTQTSKGLLHLMGLTIKTDIKKKIKSNIAPKLKTRTGTALWDTGQLINSIRYRTSLGGKD